MSYFLVFARISILPLMTLLKNQVPLSCLQCRSVFQWTGDGTLKGFAAFSLSKFNVSDFTDETRPDGVFKPEDGICYYRDFRGDQSQVKGLVWPLGIGDRGLGATSS